MLVSLLVVASIGFAVKEQYDANHRMDSAIESVNENLKKQQMKTDSISKITDSLNAVNNAIRNTLSDEGKKEYDERAKQIEKDVNAFAKHLSDSLDKANGTKSK